MGPPARLSLPHALALGLAHGPAELLPISSSAHTILIPFLAGWPYDELDPELRKSFEVALHAGTAAALLVDLRSLESHPVLRSLFYSGSRGEGSRPHRESRRRSRRRAGRRSPRVAPRSFPPARRCSSSRSPSSHRRSPATPSSNPSNAASADPTRSSPACCSGARRWRSPTPARRTEHARSRMRASSTGCCSGWRRRARSSPGSRAAAPCSPPRARADSVAPTPPRWPGAPGSR